MFGTLLALIDDEDDREKFKRIYTHYRNMIYLKAFSILKDHSLAEDATQDSLVKIAREIKKIDGICDKTTALIRIIVTHSCAELMRKDSGRDDIPYDDAIDSGDDIIHADAEMLMKNDGLNFVTGTIVEMSETYRDVLSLKYIYGYSISETAEILGISELNTKVRLYRARRKLKIILEENGYAIK